MGVGQKMDLSESDVQVKIPMFGFIFHMGSGPDLESVERLSRNMTLWMLAFSP
jgi:hypothetical protein